MKLKKGKVYPSPSSSSSSSSSSLPGDGDDVVFSVLKLLPATILTLASVLSLEDKEVLAYMITRSLKTTTNPQNPNSSSSSSPHKKPSRKPPNSKSPNSNLNKVPIFTNSIHKVPIFDCDCFTCYTSYWYRWDSSANRELIHQAIEAFEDHLTNGEQSKKQQKGINKRRENKSGRRVVDKPVAVDILLGQPEMEEERESFVLSPEIDADDGVSTPEEKVGGGGGGEKKLKDMVSVAEVVVAVETEDVAAVVRSPAAGVSNHKGLARKVLPDVLGILNSRLWSLWGPNV